MTFISKHIYFCHEKCGHIDPNNLYELSNSQKNLKLCIKMQFLALFPNKTKFANFR